MMHETQKLSLLSFMEKRPEEKSRKAFQSKKEKTATWVLRHFA